MARISMTLYIAGDTPRSQRAISNLRQLADESLLPDYDLRIIDVVEDPESAERARILTTPTVIKEAPGPVRRVTGDLSDSGRVLDALALEIAPRPGPEPEGPR